MQFPINRENRLENHRNHTEVLGYNDTTFSDILWFVGKQNLFTYTEKNGLSNISSGPEVVTVTKEISTNIYYYFI